MLLNLERELIAALQHFLGRELIQKRGDRALYDVLFLRAARGGPWGKGLV
jgi:hypothetical protein